MAELLDRYLGLSVDPGTRTAVVGLSGSGKTTLLRLVVGFEAPDAGRIVLGSTTVAGDGVFVPAHRRGVGMVAQEGALFPHLSVGENIGFGLPRGSSNRSGEVADLMRLVGLDPAMAARRPDQLSGGQQQRVALARAMARRPRLMLLDEPFSALDTALRTSTRQAIATVLERAGIAVLLVTHDQAEAMSFADQVAVLRHGKLAQIGSPAELYAQPVDPETAEFLGAALILPAKAEGGWADCALGRVSLRVQTSGPITLMLRPEQIDLSPRADGRAACHAEILDADYAGPFCTYGARLQGHEKPMRIRQAGVVRFSKGDIVAVTVQGQAHTFRVC